MDILNFISWIRGKRQVTTVDPAKTLLPVGIKDPKRDDEYIAGAISVEDFAAQIAPPPTPSTNIYNSDGTLTGNRSVYGNNANSNLQFVNLSNFSVGANGKGFLNIGGSNTQLGFNDSNIINNLLFQSDSVVLEANGNVNGIKLETFNRVYSFGQITGNNVTTLKIDDAAAFPVQVSGVNVSSGTAGAASGQFLNVTVNGADYKIALLNP